jgi:hypothetical protein
MDGLVCEGRVGAGRLVDYALSDEFRPTTEALSPQEAAEVFRA